MTDPTAALRTEREPSCAPVVPSRTLLEEAQTLATSFKALADPTRVNLLCMVATHEASEACVCDLTEPTGLSQPTISHHLKILVEAGLLHRTKRGVWSYYTLVPGALDKLAGALIRLGPQSS